MLSIILSCAGAPPMSGNPGYGRGKTRVLSVIIVRRARVILGLMWAQCVRRARDTPKKKTRYQSRRSKKNNTVLQGPPQLTVAGDCELLASRASWFPRESRQKRASAARRFFSVFHAWQISSGLSDAALKGALKPKNPRRFSACRAPKCACSRRDSYQQGRFRNSGFRYLFVNTPQFSANFHDACQTAQTTF